MLPFIRTHADVDRFSLRLHEAVADCLRIHPERLNRARDHIARWKRQLGDGAPRDLDVWAQYLDGPFEQVLTLLVAPTEEATRLRQSSPFCGIITQAQRRAIFREVFSSNES